MARPVLYDRDYCVREAGAFLQHVRENDDCVTLAGFLKTREYSPDSWERWQKRHGDDEEFSGPIKLGLAVMEDRIVTKALRKEYDVTFSIFLLANKFGYSRTDASKTPPAGPVPTLAISVSADGVKLDTRLPEIGPDDPDDEHNADDEAGAIDP